MTNKGSARRHGFQQTHTERPVTPQHKKNNTATAAIKREKLRALGLAC